MKWNTGQKRVNPSMLDGNRRSCILKQTFRLKLLVCLSKYDLLLPPSIKELIAVTNNLTRQLDLQILIPRSNTHIQTRLTFFKQLQWSSNDYLDCICTPADIYLVKIKNGKTRSMCEILSELRIRTPERQHWCHSGVFIINCEYISCIVLVFPLYFHCFGIFQLWASKYQLGKYR